MSSLRNIKDCTRKKKLEEKPDTYPPNTCVLVGDSILNGVIERNLSNNLSVKVRKFPGATVDDLRHHALPTIWKQPKYIIIHAGTNDAVKLTSRDILNKLLQLKSFILGKITCCRNNNFYTNTEIRHR